MTSWTARVNGTNASNFIRILRTRSLFTGHCETVLSVIASAFTEISPFVGKYSGAAFGREVAVESGENLSLQFQFRGT